VLGLVINGSERLGRNQAAIRPHWVPPAFPLGVNSVTLYIILRDNRESIVKKSFNTICVNTVSG
jgi:hypothetical protein